jgi:repressor LexA
VKKIHPTQEALLKLLESNISDPLTIRGLQDILSISSPSIVHHHIQQLEKKGFLKRNPFNSKDYQLLAIPDKPIVYLNFYGLGVCGPGGSILDGNPIDRIPIASRLINFSAVEAFLIQAKGDSMAPKIKEGDMIIAQKKHVAENGDIIICVNASQTLIKRFYQLNNQVKLHSENKSKYPPFTVNEDFRVEGIVRGIISYN